ncbi:MAG TPA: Na+/H+ antiporter subunit E [Vicinamibacterales bacterium]|nr:Na+/H+ antiporter subunit E [Vicinamibacterales bacterium]
MISVLWLLGLSLVWVGLTGTATAGNLLVGALLGYVVLHFAQDTMGFALPLRRMRRAIGLGFFFVWELVLASLRVAYDVITPTHHMAPAVVGIPLDARTDAEITMLATLVSLTPGTLSLDVSDDRRVLFIHAMYVYDRERLVRSIKNGFERRVLEVLR